MTAAIAALVTADFQTGLTILPAPTPANIVPLLDEAALVAKLLALKGSSYVTFLSVTMPKHRKTGNAYRDNFYKVSRVNGLVNFHYDENVIKRLAAEGKDETEFRRGGSYHTCVLTEDDRLTPLAIHKEDASAVVGWADHHTLNGDGRPADATGKALPLAQCCVRPFRVSNLSVGRQRLYLRFQHTKSLEHEYRCLNGLKADVAALSKPPHALIPSNEIEPFLYESDYSNQGVEEGNELRILTYGLSSLRQIALGNERFRVEI